MTRPPLLDKSGGIALITDGSANWVDRSGGWAYIALDALDGIYKASSYRGDTTNNQMELVAPTKGLEWLLSHCGPCHVLVYCDSEYVVLGATDRTRKRNKNRKQWNALDRVVDQHARVEFVHIRGHQGHIWNEMADQMAVRARKSKGMK